MGRSKDYYTVCILTVPEPQLVFTDEMTNCSCGLKCCTKQKREKKVLGSVMTCGDGCPFIP